MSEADPIPRSPAESIEWISVERLFPSARNARTHSDEQIGEIAASMREWGWTVPVLVDEQGELIAGHGRLLAAHRLGLASVPAMTAEGWSEEAKRAYRIADNRLAERAGWDDELLRVELEALEAAEFDIGLTGFSADDLDELRYRGRTGNTDPDDVPRPLPEAATRVGELWILGDHRLYVGDSTQHDSFAALLNNTGDRELPVAMWTDPPYNVGYTDSQGRTIENDAQGDQAFAAFLTQVFGHSFEHMAPGGAVYIAHGDGRMGESFRAAMREGGVDVRQCLIWVKNRFTIARQDYQWQHEPILYGWTPGAGHRWYADRSESTVVDDEKPLEKMTKAELLEIARAVQTDVHREDKPKRNADHPTMKPVHLIARHLENNTRRGDPVLDPFSGSGSTLIACEQIECKARVIELDPVYADVTIRRWQAFADGRAYRASDGAAFDELSSGAQS